MIKRSRLDGMVGGAKEKNLEIINKATILEIRPIINKAIGVIGSDDHWILGKGIVWLELEFSNRKD